MWLGKFYWGRNVYVALKRKEENMETSCTLIIVMENGCIFMFIVGVWFYLEYAKRGENSLY